LGGSGHAVREAADGAEGLRAYRQRPADLVVCDVFMSGMDGLETVSALRAESPGVRVLMVSGGSPETPANYLPFAWGVGAAARRRRPFKPAELLAAVDRVLRAG